MKPEFLPAYIAILITVMGLLVNGAWAVHNLHVRSEIRRMVGELKDYVRSECVDRKFCDERHEEILRRLGEIGA